MDSVNSKVLRVVDTRLEASDSNHTTWVLKEGAMTTNYTPLPATGYSNQGISWNLNNIGQNINRDPRLCIGITAVTTIQVTNSSATATNLIQDDNFGFKPWPCNRLWSVVHQINGASETLNTYDLIDYLSRVNVLPEDMNFFDNTQPDIIDTYGPAATGSNISPLASYSATIQGDGVFKPRSVNYTCTSTVGGVTTQNSSAVPGSGTSGGVALITITATFYEPLITPFTNVSSKNCRGLYGITGEIITLTLQPDIFNNMNAFVVPPVAGGALTVNSAVTDLTTVKPVLYTILLTPYTDMQHEVPYESVYEYNKFTLFASPNVANSVSAGAQLQNQTSVVAQYDVMPDKIATYIRTTNGSRLANVPDKYLRFDNASFTMNNGNPQLAAASRDQVYDISVRNQLKMPRICWKQGILNYSLSIVSPNNGVLYGSAGPVILDPVFDLNLQSGLAAGSQGQFTFQMTSGSFTNATATEFGPVSLYVVATQKGVLRRQGIEYTNGLLRIPQQALEEAHALPPIMLDQYNHSLRKNAFLGGSLNSFAKDLWSRLKKVGRFAVKNPDKIVAVAQAVKPFFEDDDEKKGGRKSKKHMRGGEEAMDLFYE